MVQDMRNLCAISYVKQANFRHSCLACDPGIDDNVGEDGDGAEDGLGHVESVQIAIADSGKGDSRPVQGPEICSIRGSAPPVH